MRNHWIVWLSYCLLFWLSDRLIKLSAWLSDCLIKVSDCSPPDGVKKTPSLLSWSFSSSSSSSSPSSSSSLLPFLLHLPSFSSLSLGWSGEEGANWPQLVTRQSQFYEIYVNKIFSEFKFKKICLYKHYGTSHSNYMKYLTMCWRPFCAAAVVLLVNAFSRL